MNALGSDGINESGDPAIDDRPPAIGSDERRMHVRAYNFWVSLLEGRAYPAIEDLDPANAGDFGEHALLLDFTRDEANPAITYIGDALREECGIDGMIATIADVPSRTLLSRLTDHYLQILANRAPIGFEAEFVDQRDAAMLYRGILMPFSSNGETIDHVYGVINWKALAAPAELGVPAPATLPVATPSLDARPWADGPGGALSEADDPEALDGRLARARDAAARAEESWVDCRATLHRALDLAHGLMLAADRAPADYAALLATAGIGHHPAPRAAILLTFGPAIDATRTAELTDVLAHARRIGVPMGGLARHLDGERGGAKALIAAERERRAAKADARARAMLRTAPAEAGLPTLAGGDGFALLLARRGDDGQTEIVGRVPKDTGLVREAVRSIARDARAAA